MATSFELVHASGKEPYTLAFGENLEDPDAPFFAFKQHEDGSVTIAYRRYRRNREAEAVFKSIAAKMEADLKEIMEKHP